MCNRERISNIQPMKMSFVFGWVRLMPLVKNNSKQKLNACQWEFNNWMELQPLPAIFQTDNNFSHSKMNQISKRVIYLFTYILYTVDKFFYVFYMKSTLSCLELALCIFDECSCFRYTWFWAAADDLLICSHSN